MISPRDMLELLIAFDELYPEHTGLTPQQISKGIESNRRLQSVSNWRIADLDGLKEAVRDNLKGVIEFFDPEEVVRFDNEIRQRTGNSIFDFEASWLRKVNAIKRRGKILNEFEHRLILETMEDSWEDGRLDQIAEMVRNYEDEIS